MSFASEPGQDDGSLPPVNIVIPGVVRDHDVDRWQAVIVPPRLAGEAHRYLFRRGTGYGLLL